MRSCVNDDMRNDFKMLNVWTLEHTWYFHVYLKEKYDSVFEQLFIITTVVQGFTEQQQIVGQMATVKCWMCWMHITNKVKIMGAWIHELNA